MRREITIPDDCVVRGWIPGEPECGAKLRDTQFGNKLPGGNDDAERRNGGREQSAVPVAMMMVMQDWASEVAQRE